MTEKHKHKSSPELEKEIYTIVREHTVGHQYAEKCSRKIVALLPDEEAIRKDESEAIIRCITDAKRVHPDWGIDDILELLQFREETREAMKNQSGNYVSLEEVRQALKGE